MRIIFVGTAKSYIETEKLKGNFYVWPPIIYNLYLSDLLYILFLVFHLTLSCFTVLKAITTDMI